MNGIKRPNQRNGRCGKLIFSLLMALMLVLGTGTSVFAADGDGGGSNSGNSISAEKDGLTFTVTSEKFFKGNADEYTLKVRTSKSDTETPISGFRFTQDWESGLAKKEKAALNPTEDETVRTAAYFTMVVLDSSGKAYQYLADDVKITVSGLNLKGENGRVAVFASYSESDFESRDRILNQDENSISFEAEAYSLYGSKYQFCKTEKNLSSSLTSNSIIYSVSEAYAPVNETESTYKSYEDSTWRTGSIDLPAASEGVDLSYDITEVKADQYEAAFTLTIGADVDAAELDINFGNVFKEIISKIQEEDPGWNVQPGDKMKFSVKIDNRSGYTYQYAENTFTGDLLIGESEESSQFQSFSGESIGAGPHIWRTGNAALADLCGKTLTSLTAKDLTNANLEPLLKKKGYTNGIDDLAVYYLNYYNNKEGLQATQLDQLPADIIAEILGGSAYLYGGVEEGAETGKTTGRENVRELAELGYNYFYNDILTIYPEAAELDASVDYSLGGYMRAYNNGEATPMESWLTDAFSAVGSGSTSELGTKIVRALDGEHMTNVYQINNFGYTFGFKLQREDIGYYYTGSLSVTKNVTEMGKALGVYNTFYVGLFNDEACTTLATDADGNPIIVELKMGGAASKTVTRDGVPLGTFYVAETDAEGNVLSPGDGHRITIDQSQVEIAEGAAAQVTVTNDYDDYEGYYREGGGDDTVKTSRETTQSEESAEENNGSSAQTGDDANMTLYVLLALAAATAGAVLVITRKRNKA